MAFAEMLSDENIKAAVQACHGESNHICTYELQLKLNVSCL